MSALRRYLRTTHPAIVVADVLRIAMLLAFPVAGLLYLRWVATSQPLFAPIHQALWPTGLPRGHVYRGCLAGGLLINAAWISGAIRNFVLITVTRSDARGRRKVEEDKLALPAWPYNRESFAVVLGELQDRDGARVPSERSPHLRPRWLTLPEKALYTGVFVTGGIGSGKTAAVAYPALRQLIGFRRPLAVRHRDGRVTDEEWKFSGLILDEKGDFTRAAARYCEEWGRSADLIRIAPKGEWIWNVIYNPNLPTWAVAYQLGWIIKNFNKGATGSDPFWENAPKELVTEYLTLLDDAEDYYTLADYLELLIDNDRQNDLNDRAERRFKEAGDDTRLEQCKRRWTAIMRRRNKMGPGLRGALEACAKAGIDMFRFPELQKTFCPTKKEYFDTLADGRLVPKKNVFTGFDQILEHGKIVGLEAPKQIYFDAAVFLQVALKSQWQDAVLRREGIGADGKPLAPPRFGERIGYCPTFLMADEAQLSATPKDGEFKAVCRSKRASMWELTQSHGSIKGAFGPAKAVDANTYFQNSMTHVYLRQSDIDSMKVIQEECGKKLVQKTTLAYTEGGQASALSYVQGGIVHEGMGVSATKTVATEEKPFVELERLKTLPNNVALVLPSNGDRTLPATITFLRPLWVFDTHPNLPKETPWFDWPEDLRVTYDLDDVPQEIGWKGWEGGAVVEATETSVTTRQPTIIELPPTTAARPAPPSSRSPADELSIRSKSASGPGPTVSDPRAPNAARESYAVAVLGEGLDLAADDPEDVDEDAG